MSERNQVQLPPIAAVLAELMSDRDYMAEVSAPAPDLTKEDWWEMTQEIAPGYPRKHFETAWAAWQKRKADEER